MAVEKEYKNIQCANVIIHHISFLGMGSSNTLYGSPDARARGYAIIMVAGSSIRSRMYVCVCVCTGGGGGLLTKDGRRSKEGVVLLTVAKLVVVGGLLLKSNNCMCGPSHFYNDDSCKTKWQGQSDYWFINNARKFV